MNQDSVKVELSLNDLKLRLKNIRKILINEHQSLFLDQLDDLILKVEIFGYHFATLDIRQDSRIHSYVFNKIIKKIKPFEFNNYNCSNYIEKCKFLSSLHGNFKPSFFISD